MVDAAASDYPIEFVGVTKAFGRKTVLDNVSFTVPEGSVVGLLGPNGAGKSTAMRVLLGLQRASGGEARVYGHAAGTSGFRAALHRVGSIIETPPLFRNATAMENLEIRVAALGLSTKDAEVHEMLGTVGLAERADDKVGSFSLGMRQRVGLALALVGRPSLVVLDEPTNGLDPEGAVEIRDLIRDLPSRGTTALVCTHRLDEVEKSCGYVVVLRGGRLVTQGAIADILGRASSRGLSLEVRPEEVTIAVRVLGDLGLPTASVVGGTVTTRTVVDDPSRITRALAEAGVFLRALWVHRATLEDVFLEITHEEPGAGS